MTDGAPARGKIGRSVAVRLAVLALTVVALRVTPSPQRALDAGRDARSAIESGDYSRALFSLNETIAFAPWSADDLALRARVLLERGDLAAARADLVRLAEVRPLAASETITLAALELQEGQPERADQTLAEAISRGLLGDILLRAVVDDAFTERSWFRAQAALRGLAILDPHDSGALARLALVEALDQPERALATIEKVSEVDDDWAARLGDLRAALAARPGQLPDAAFAALGVAYVGLAEYELADEALARATELNPAYGEALAYRAFARAKLGLPALAAAEQAVALAPDSPSAHYLVGLTWKTLGRHIEARAAFESAYALDPSNPSIAVEIATTHRIETNSAAADAWLQEAVRLSGGDWRFRLLLAQFYVDENYRVAEAGLPLAQQLVIDAPDSAEAHDALGWAYFLLGGLDRAEEQLDRALALEPALARAHLHKAALLEAKGDPLSARSEYEQAVRLDPDGVFGALARRALERLAGSAP